jgi:heat shock protein HslJ
MITGCKKEEQIPINEGYKLKISGGYVGILPCPDCEGINYEIDIKPDMTYRERMVFIGRQDDRPVTVEGKWEFEGPEKIRLYKKTDAMSRFAISKGSIIMLDENGNRISGADSVKYILKPGSMQVIEKKAPDTTAKINASINADSSISGKWNLIEINGQKPDEGNYMTGIPDLEISQADLKFTSNSGCNRTKGGVQIVNNGITFSKFFSTKMTCPGTGESEYVNTLRSVDTFKIEKGVLILNAAGKTVLKFKK